MITNAPYQKTTALPRTIIQPKLMVNAPNDAFEQEADAVADRVMRMPLVSSKAQGTQGMLASSIQRKCAHCEEEKKKMPVMRKADNGGGFETSPAFASQLSNTRGGGQAMPSETRGFMESRFGRDFSNVRVHTDGQAANMNRDIQAKAFTHGSDIYFNQGEFAPNTEGGKRLLAHELTHTVQQEEDDKVQRMIELPKGTNFNTQAPSAKKSGNFYSFDTVNKSGSINTEILTSMLKSERIFAIKGSTQEQVDNNYWEHVKARKGIIEFASKKKYSFGAGRNFKMNPKYWSVDSKDFELKSGQDPKKAIDDLNVNPQEYAIACKAATQLTMVGGSESELVNDSSSIVDDWVPGDWGYIKNDKPDGRVGYEGENLIYTGKDTFWGHFSGTNTYRHLNEWFNEVKGWNGSASISDQRNYPNRGLRL